MRKCKSKYDILRQRIYIVVYGANTPAGRLFDLILLGVILLSVVLVMLETVEKLEKQIQAEQSKNGVLKKKNNKLTDDLKKANDLLTCAKIDLACQKVRNAGLVEGICRCCETRGYEW